jgi:hypothetical protein
MKSGLLLALLLLSSCAADRFVVTPASMQQRADSAARAHGMVAKKLTFEGPVTFTSQTGTGNVVTASATDNTKAGQRGGAAATAPGAVATATTKTGLSYWWLLLVPAVVVYWQRKRLVLLFG